MKCFSDVIDAFGVATLKRVLGAQDESHIRVMKTRNSIPARYWSALVNAAPKHGVKGVTWQSLHAMHSARFSGKRAAS